MPVRVLVATPVHPVIYMNCLYPRNYTVPLRKSVMHSLRLQAHWLRLQAHWLRLQKHIMRTCSEPMSRWELTKMC